LADKKLIKSLNPKQKQFVHHYIKKWNATKSYQKVYGTESPETAKASASRLLTNVNVQKYIKECLGDLEKIAKVSKLGNILEARKIAYSNEVKETDKLKAIEVVNKMMGWNEPDKVQDVTDGDPSKLTDDEIVKYRELRGKMMSANG